MFEKDFILRVLKNQFFVVDWADVYIEKEFEYYEDSIQRIIWSIWL